MRIKLYNELKRTGDLFEMFLGMSGDWNTDKESFIEQQEALESFSNNIDTDGEYID